MSSAVKPPPRHATVADPPSSPVESLVVPWKRRHGATVAYAAYAASCAFSLRPASVHAEASPRRPPCNSSLRDQSAAYAAVPADGSNDLRLYSQMARNYRVCTRVRVELSRDVRSVCRVLVARCGESAEPVGDSYAIRTRRLLGWHRAAASRRAAPHGHGPSPCRPAAAYCPRGSSDAERQRADGLAPDRRRHSSPRAHPRVGADQ
jgi:hypothetical protein